MESIKIHMLPRHKSENRDTMEHITTIINRVYRIAEEGLYKETANRTTIEEIMELTRNSEIAVARINETIVGSIRISQIDDHTGALGMLAVNDMFQQKGIGKKLIDFAEEKCREAQLEKIQLELLVPIDGTHPIKTILEKWYTRIDYRAVGTETIEDIFPKINNKLAVPCQFIIFHKYLMESLH